MWLMVVKECHKPMTFIYIYIFFRLVAHVLAVTPQSAPLLEYLILAPVPRVVVHHSATKTSLVSGSLLLQQNCD